MKTFYLNLLHFLHRKGLLTIHFHKIVGDEDGDKYYHTPAVSYFKSNTGTSCLSFLGFKNQYCFWTGLDISEYHEFKPQFNFFLINFLCSKNAHLYRNIDQNMEGDKELLLPKLHECEFCNKQIMRIPYDTFLPKT